MYNYWGCSDKAWEKSRGEMRTDTKVFERRRRKYDSFLIAHAEKMDQQTYEFLRNSQRGGWQYVYYNGKKNKFRVTFFPPNLQTKAMASRAEIVFLGRL